MHLKNHNKLIVTKKGRGFALLESLVAIVVMALGILGILGVQMRTLTDTQAGMRRAQAIRIVEDLGERLQNNPDAIGNLSVYTTAPGSTANCMTTTCDAAALAAFDIKQWRDSLQNSLPGGTATIFIPQGGPRQLGVMIGWNENRFSTDGSTPTTAQANALRAPLTVTGTDSTGATVSCPIGSTCHIQYIQPTQRCAPWSVGGGSLYCAS